MEAPYIKHNCWFDSPVNAEAEALQTDQVSAISREWIASWASGPSIGVLSRFGHFEEGHKSGGAEVLM